MIEIKRKEGESISAFLHRFSTKVKQSGVLIESKKRRYHHRPISKVKRRQSALYREQKQKDFEKTAQKGLI